MILSTKVNVMVIRRFCLEDDEKRVFWVVRFHVVKNRWSCSSIGIVLIKVRSMVNDVLYIMIIIGSIKAWGFNLFLELLMDMELVGEGFAWCCEWILLLKIILDIIIKQNDNFTYECRKINLTPSLVTLRPIVINLSLVINLRFMTIVKWWNWLRVRIKVCVSCWK